MQSWRARQGPRDEIDCRTARYPLFYWQEKATTTPPLLVADPLVIVKTVPPDTVEFAVTLHWLPAAVVVAHDEGVVAIAEPLVHVVEVLFGVTVLIVQLLPVLS